MAVLVLSWEAVVVHLRAFAGCSVLIVHSLLSDGVHQILYWWVLLRMVVHLQAADPCWLLALVAVVCSAAAVAQLSVVLQEVADGAKLRLMPSLLVLHHRHRDEIVHPDGLVATEVMVLEKVVIVKS